MTAPATQDANIVMADPPQETERHAVSLRQDEDTIIQVLTNSLYPNAAPQSVRMVLGYCRAAGLDPMQKPVHIVPMWDSNSRAMRDVVMPGIGLYRTQAARSGTYAGMSEPEFGPDTTQEIGGMEITFPLWCKVVVRRLLPSGTIAEFPAKERWVENYAVKGGKERSIAPNAMWGRRPYGQIAKCAEAQALRKAFPEFGAAPTAEEMEGRSLNEDVAPLPPTPPPPAAKPEYPAADFAKNLPAWTGVIKSGRKVPDDFISFAVSRGVPMTAEQQATLRAIKKDAPTEVVDEFVADMDAAERREEGAV